MKSPYLTHHKGLAIVLEKGEAARRFYFFWLYQYVKRNKVFQDAWKTWEAINAGGRQGSDYKPAMDMLRRYKWVRPEQELFKNGRVYLRDEANGRGYMVVRNLTPERMLWDILEIHEGQQITGSKSPLCHYELPSYRMVLDEFKPKIKGITTTGGRLSIDYANMQPEEIAAAVSVHQEIHNAWHHAGDDKSRDMRILPRIIGLMLYDDYIKSDAQSAAIDFLSRYGDIGPGARDPRIPASYRQESRIENLHRLRRNTAKCIDQMDVLPMRR